MQKQGDGATQGGKMFSGAPCAATTGAAASAASTASTATQGGGMF